MTSQVASYYHCAGPSRTTSQSVAGTHHSPGGAAAVGRRGEVACNDCHRAGQLCCSLIRSCCLSLFSFIFRLKYLVPGSRRLALTIKTLQCAKFSGPVSVHFIKQFYIQELLFFVVFVVVAADCDCTSLGDYQPVLNGNAQSDIILYK